MELSYFSDPAARRAIVQRAGGAGAGTTGGGFTTAGGGGGAAQMAAAQRLADDLLDSAALTISRLHFALGHHSTSMALQVASGLQAVAAGRSIAGGAGIADAAAAAAPPPPQPPPQPPLERPPSALRVQLRVIGLSGSVVVEEAERRERGGPGISTKGLLRLLVRPSHPPCMQACWRGLCLWRG